MAYSNKEIETFKEIILEQLSNGKSLMSILAENKNLPTRPRVYEWLNDAHNKYDKDFRNNYARARENSADIDAERVDDIAEKTLKGEYDPAAARVAIDAKKWAAGVKKPKKYGSKLDLTTGGDKIVNDKMTDEELDARIKELAKNA